jgi:hypothetical protein
MVMQGPCRRRTEEKEKGTAATAAAGGTQGLERPGQGVEEETYRGRCQGKKGATAAPPFVLVLQLASHGGRRTAQGRHAQ